MNIVGKVLNGKFKDYNIYQGESDALGLFIGKPININTARPVCYIGKRTAETYIVAWEKYEELEKRASLLKLGGATILFGIAGGYVANQISKGKIYNVAVQYNDGSKSLLQITDKAFTKFLSSTFNIKYGLDLSSENTQVVSVTKRAININPDNITPTLKRAAMFLEEKDWETAADYYNAILDVNPELVEAYIGLLCADLHIVDENELVNQEKYFADNINFKRAISFSDESKKATLNEYVKERELLLIYKEALTYEQRGEFNLASKKYNEVSSYKDSYEKAKECSQRYRENAYINAISLMNQEDYNEAINEFKKASNWKDSELKIEKCKAQIEEKEKKKKELEKQEKEKQIAKQKEEEQRKQEQRKETVRSIKICAIIGVAILIIVIIISIWGLIQKGNIYDNAIKAGQQGKYKEALELLEENEDYKESEKYITEFKARWLCDNPDEYLLENGLKNAIKDSRDIYASIDVKLEQELKEDLFYVVQYLDAINYLEMAPMTDPNDIISMYDYSIQGYHDLEASGKYGKELVSLLSEYKKYMTTYSNGEDFQWVSTFIGIERINKAQGYNKNNINIYVYAKGFLTLASFVATKVPVDELKHATLYEVQDHHNSFEDCENSFGMIIEGNKLTIELKNNSKDVEELVLKRAGSIL